MSGSELALLDRLERVVAQVHQPVPPRGVARRGLEVDVALGHDRPDDLLHERTPAADQLHRTELVTGEPLEPTRGHHVTTLVPQVRAGTSPYVVVR